MYMQSILLVYAEYNIQCVGICGVYCLMSWYMRSILFNELVYAEYTVH